MGSLNEFTREMGRSVEFRHAEALQHLRDSSPRAFDSRFGIRALPKSSEEPSVFSYSNPGRGVNGEHLS